MGSNLWDTRHDNLSRNLVTGLARRKGRTRAFFIQRRDDAIQHYHNEIIKEVYERWLAAEVHEEKRVAPDPTLPQIDIAVGLTFKTEQGKILTSEIKLRPNLPIEFDAFTHLGENESLQHNADLIEALKTYDEGVDALFSWRDEIAKTLVHDLRPTNTTNPQDGEYSVPNLMNYFDRRFYRGLGAQIRLFKEPYSRLDWTTLIAVYGGETTWLANSSDPSKLTALEDGLDAWGQHYAEATKKLVSQRGIVETDLKIFKSSLTQLIRTLRFYPHTLKEKCSIEESLSGEGT